MRRPGNPRRLRKDEILTLLDMLTHDTLADMRIMLQAANRCGDLDATYATAKTIDAFTRRADALRHELDKSLV